MYVLSTGRLVRLCKRAVITLLPLEPLLERLLALGRRPADEQIVDADVFVKVWPMNSLPLANEPPPTPLLDSAVKEAGKTGQRRRDGAAISQLDRQRVVCDEHPSRRSAAGFQLLKYSCQLSSKCCWFSSMVS